MKTPIVLLALSSLNFVVFAQEKISYNANARPLVEVAQDLELKIGKKLKIAGSIPSQTLVIHVKNVSADELLSKIASTVNAEWKEIEPGTLQLVGSQSKIATVTRERFAERVAKAKDILSKMTLDDAAGGLGGGFQGGGMMVAMVGGSDGSGPAVKVLKQILKLMDPAAIAGVGASQRLVLSTSPNQMQLRLPPAAGPLLHNLIAEHNKFVIEANKKMLEVEQENNSPGNEQENKMMEMFKPKPLQPITSEPAEAIVSLEQNQFAGIFGSDWPAATLKLYDTKGNVVLSASTGLEKMDFAAFMPNAQKPASDPANAKKLEFGTLSKEFQTMTPDFGGFGSPELKISKELRAQLKHPEKFDPLSYVYGEGLGLIADQRKLNIVANIPDSVDAGMMMLMQGGGAELTDAALLDRLNKGACKSVQADGWLTVSPTDPISAAEAHLDRIALAQIIKVAHEKGTPSLDEMAEYAKTSPDPIRSQLSMKYFQLAPTLLSQSASGMVRWDVLKFYGLLGRDSRNLVRGGQPLSLQVIPPAATTVLKRLLFGSGAKFITEKSANQAKDGNLMTRAMEMFANGTPTILDEPTEVMPSGIPARGFLKINVSADSVVMPVGADGEAAGGVMGPEEVALYRFLQEDQTIGQQIPIKQNFDRLQTGDRTKLDLRIYVDRDILSQFELMDFAMKRDGKPVALNGTSKEFQAQVDKLVADYKKNGLPFSMGGGPRPKP